MEGNKVEALRSRQMAELKFMQNDPAAARKLALKAQTLYPDLEGLSQLIPVFEVHAMATAKEKTKSKSKSKKIPPAASEPEVAEPDWYGILQLEEGSNEDTIQGQYQKLSLLLNPDKNKCMGAEGAFKLVTDAWGVLSDVASRSAYDARRKKKKTTGAREVTKASSDTPNPNPKPNPNLKPALAASNQAFWTCCPSCRMQFEYLRIYENRNLCCPLCRIPFLAKEVDIATVPTPWSLPWGGVGGAVPGGNAKNTTTTTQSPNKGKSTKTKKPAAAAALAPKKMTEKEKKKKERELLKAQEAAKAKEVFAQIMAKARSVLEQDTPPPPPPAAVAAPQSAKQKNVKTDAGKKTATAGKSKAKKKKVDPPAAKRVRSPGIAGETPAPKKARVKESGSSGGSGGKRRIEASPPYQPPPVSVDGEAISLPDPEFYDFDKDRVEASFEPGQVWAVYDESDGMPRFYAHINEVISRKPFKVNMSWLEPRPPSTSPPPPPPPPPLLSPSSSLLPSSPSPSPLDIEIEIDTVVEQVLNAASGPPCPCGEFKIGNTHASEFLNTFSHEMQVVERGPLRGVFKIYPHVGEVWALYGGGGSGAPVCDIIEILSDSETQDSSGSVKVVPLCKVSAFRTVYSKSQTRPEFSLSFGELSRFSHRILAHRLTAQEAPPGLPVGSWELDPGSIPPVMLSGPPGQPITSATNLPPP